jgi:hypothetical protein
MKRRWILNLAGLSAWFLALGLPCYAQSSNAEGTYTVTITKIEISTDGSNFVTVFSGSSAVNIASASAGAAVAGLVSGASVPPGTYNTVRVTLAANLLLKGYRNISGDTWYTQGGTDTNGFTSVSGTDQASSQSNYTISTFTIPAGNRVNTLTITAFTVKEGGAPNTVSVSFDTSGVITEVNSAPSVGAPTVSVSSS